MPAAVIRCDASFKIGTGHVMRCLALADALRRADFEVTFICRQLEGHLCERIAAAGFGVAALGAASGASWQEDAAETRAAMERLAHLVDLLVVDHYGLDARWERAARDTARRLLAIDDLADRPHDCDILLDQNFYDDADTRYAGLVPAHCVQALGPRFALLRREFYEAGRSLRQRDGVIRRVLVALGGADATNETSNALEALCRDELEHLQIDVLVGGLYRHKAELLARYGRSPRVRFHESTVDVAALMAAADLSIGGGGTMNWERCFVGLPSLVIVIAENQRATSEALHRAGIAVNMGWHAAVTVARIEATVRQLLADPARVRDLSQRALALMAPTEGTVQGPKILQLLLGSKA